MVAAHGVGLSTHHAQCLVAKTSALKFLGVSDQIPLFSGILLSRLSFLGGSSVVTFFLSSSLGGCGCLFFLPPRDRLKGLCGGGGTRLSRTWFGSALGGAGALFTSILDRIAVVRASFHRYLWFLRTSTRAGENEVYVALCSERSRKTFCRIARSAAIRNGSRGHSERNWRSRY